MDFDATNQQQSTLFSFPSIWTCCSFFISADVEEKESLPESTPPPSPPPPPPQDTTHVTSSSKNGSAKSFAERIMVF
jgi:hypothetical protein